MFLVPYNKLSETQKHIIRKVSRGDENLFIEGPPGSGKTLISLYTLKNMIRTQAVKPLLLIYNHSLYGYLRSALQEMDLVDNIMIATKDKYFWELARTNNVQATGNNYEEEYTQLLRGLLNINHEPIFDIAVIDEVQDLRKEEWELIKKLCRRITSLGDFNQGVYKTELSKTDVIQKGRSEVLTDIFRFHKSIAKTAQLFSKSKQSLEDKVSRIEQNDIQLIDIKSVDNAQTIANIITSLKRQKGRVGIISHNRENLKRLKEALNALEIEATYYKSNKELRSHHFGSEVPLLITSHSAKGLEFDHVILFGFDEGDSNISNLRKSGILEDTLYVALTRANTNLYIIRNENTITEINSISVESNVDDFTIDDIF